MVRTGPYGDLFGAEPDGLTFGRLVGSPHGIDLGPLRPRIPEVLQTASGTVELAPGVMAPAIEGLAADLGAGPPAPDGERPFALVGRRHVRSNNSWMHNVEVLGEGPGPLPSSGSTRPTPRRWASRDGGRARVSLPGRAR